MTVADEARLIELLALTDRYVARLVVVAREAKRRSETGEEPVEIVVRFDGGVMYLGRVVPAGREQIPDA